MVIGIEQSLIISAMLLGGYYGARRAIADVKKRIYDAAERDLRATGVKVFQVKIPDNGNHVEHCSCGCGEFYSPVVDNNNVVACVRCRTRYEISCIETEV